jgi:multidrug resistance efflux pump
MPTEPVADTEAQKAAAEAAQRKSRLVRVVAGALLVLFLYNLIADRYTPYSSQATVDTFLVQIAPEVSGPVQLVGVADNRAVKKGQLLFQIDRVPYEIALRAAEANLTLAQQGASSAEADVRVADATLRKQRVDLDTTQELGGIVFGLSSKGALPETSAIRARADIAKSQADILKAQAEAERARVRLGQTGPDNAQVRQAQVAVEQAKLDLRRTTVRAPADGVVTNLRLSAGQYASKGAPVLSFIAAGPRWVTVDMRENQLGHIRRGARARVTFDDHPGEVFAAHVESVGWGVSQGDETPNGQLATVTAPTGWLREPQSFPVRIVLDPPADPKQPPLPPGRNGAQASVVILTQDTSIMNPLARLWIWAVAMLSYLQ